MRMPMSYGIGVAYRFSDEFTTAIELYRTEWDDFVITDSEGRKTSPITGLSPSDTSPTCQLRAGAEYLFTGSEYVVSDPGRMLLRPRQRAARMTYSVSARDPGSPQTGSARTSRTSTASETTSEAP